MLHRHHGDGKQKAACREQEVEDHAICPWSVRTTPLLATPIMMECCICSGPIAAYTMEEDWQPRERTQVSPPLVHRPAWDTKPGSYRGLISISYYNCNYPFMNAMRAAIVMSHKH